MEIILATNNAHKVGEYRRILEPLGFTVFSQREKGAVLEPEEDGTTFAENALIKAKALYDFLKLPVIADDSGLCVEALGGAPGIYSARYGGEGLDDRGRNRLLLQNMEGKTDRRAAFVCAIAYIDAAGESHLFEGRCEGEIAFAERGDNAFGYDPVFLVGNKTFAELDGEKKDAVSHRGRASRKLAAYLSGQTL